MAKKTLISFIIMGLIIYGTKAAVITVPPVSVTVPPFTTATFTCEGTGNILNWWVQSAPLTDSIKQQREITVTTTTVNDTNFSSVLTVSAIPINDGLGIGCEVITTSPSSPFDRVISNSILAIRGISPVEDLQYNFTTNDSLLITWTCPVFFSNDIPHGSPVSYQVLVIDEEDGDIILDTSTLNTNITVFNITECDTFNISVTALVDQYTSINNTDIRNNGTGYVVNITTNKDNLLTPNVTIELSCPPSKSNTFLTITSGTEIIQYPITGTDGVVVYVIRTLSPSNEYNYTVLVFNLRNKLEYETYTIISTYQVIGFKINNTYTNGSVSVQCVFVPGADADGCHVTFNGTNGVNITRSTGSKLATLPAGSYNASVYDIVNQSYHGPAFKKPELFYVQILSTSTSSSIMSKSTTLTQYTVIVSSTVTDTVGTEAETLSTTGGATDDTSILIVVAGIVSSIVLMILFVLTVCAGVTVNKRKMIKKNRVSLAHSDTARQSQVEMNPYQEVIINEVPILTSPVQLISNRPVDGKENPCHITRSERSMKQWEQRSSKTSTTTQDATLDNNSISSTASNNNNNDTEYSTNPPVTVNVNNDTSTATVAPTYAVVGKRTDATPLPAVDQRVVYDKVTGDINKRGDVKFCHHYDANNIVTGDLNSTTGKDEVPADLSDSPTSYNGSDTTCDPVIKCSADSPQASPNDYICSESEEESHT